jgi:hypothetical protein
MTEHRIFFAEPMLAFGSGHFLRAIEAVADLVAPVAIKAFVSNGLKMKTDVPNLELVPHFHHTILGKGYLSEDLQKDGLYLDPFVDKALAEATARDHFFVQSADVDMVASLMRAIGRKAPDQIPMLHLRFNMLDLSPFNPEAATNAVMRTVLAEPKLSGKLHLYAELPAQIAYIRAQWGGEAELFTDVPSTDFLQARPSAGTSGGVRIGYIGDARKEKGADLLPDIIGKFEAVAPDLAAATTWVIQLSGRFSLGLAQPIIEASKRSKSRFEFYISGIDGVRKAVYNEIVYSLDMVALPYAYNNYAIRGSGVAVEATCACLPFVYTAGCAFGAPAGDSAIGAQLVEPFAAALAHMARQAPEYQARAARVRGGFLTAATQASLIQRLRRPAA